MKNVNFGGVHIRQRAGPAGCTKGQSGGLFRSHWPAFMCSSLTRPVVQPASRAFCAGCQPGLLCSQPYRRKFMLFIWKHGPPARPARRLVLYKITNCE